MSEKSVPMGKTGYKSELAMTMPPESTRFFNVSKMAARSRLVIWFGFSTVNSRIFFSSAFEPIIDATQVVPMTQAKRRLPCINQRSRLKSFLRRPGCFSGDSQPDPPPADKPPRW